MIHEGEKVLMTMQKMVDEMGRKESVTHVIYRQDYADYMIVINNRFHCEVREKLMDIYFGSKDGESVKSDAVREIKYLIENNVLEFDEFELASMGIDAIVDETAEKDGRGDPGIDRTKGTSGPKGGIIVDNSEDYDF